MSDKTVDVAVIGAGISGISAAKKLKNSRLSTIVLEASHRSGGRAYSEELTPGNWFDLGCSYLHDGQRNPFVNIGGMLNIPIDFTNGNLFTPEKTTHICKGQKICFDKIKPFYQNYEKLMHNIKSTKNDIAMAEFIDLEDLYTPLLWHTESNINAADPDQISVLDYARSINNGPDYPVPKGLGNLVKAWSFDVPIKLNTSVKTIEWDKPTAKIITSKGVVCAKSVIITVSTNIMADEDILFLPSLPKQKMSALYNLPMGTLNKVGLAFRKGYLSAADRGWYVCWPEKKDLNEKDVGSFEISTSGNNSAVVFAGGRLGKWLEQRGPKTMVEYAYSKIEEAFGSRSLKNIEKAITTAWTSEPFSKGSYSYSRPSNIRNRKELAKPLENKLFFAGEATDEIHYGTAHGAYFAGLRAAEEVILAQGDQTKADQIVSR
ncbi:MAG: NAD(P)/FAD-dependent oxidoreductase [Pseudomonadota bacterium]|nr:NAD(P)/FAD-dependent oxidoreductase [Pseudomonadota bacterium]